MAEQSAQAKSADTRIDGASHDVASNGMAKTYQDDRCNR